MIESLIELDKSLFFFFNGLHSPWLDSVMFWISDKKIWIPFYVLLAAWLIKNYKWHAIIYLLAIGLAITCTDQFISGFMKDFFQRWRPSRDPSLEGLVHLVNDYRGGKYGFASSHAGNAFALAIFFFMLWRDHKWAWLLFVWAFVVAYSRVYLGVHYPGDILTGALIGLFFGYTFVKISKKVKTTYFDKRL